MKTFNTSNIRPGAPTFNDLYPKVAKSNSWTLANSWTLGAVQDYYGKVLQSKNDLKTKACCSVEVLPAHIKEVVGLLHDETLERFYGCGAPLPVDLEGLTALDLGCGAGRDAFILSKLVGEDGQVIGVDMTSEQLEVARKHEDYHAKKFGFNRSNVTFIEGHIEDLKTVGIKDDSIDLVVSNCVFNLSPNKRELFSEILRVLKPGGELYFSDVFAGRRLPSEFARDAELLGECLGGAMYLEDFRRLMRELGVHDYRKMSQRSLDISNSPMAAKTGHIPFSSITVRVLKLELEDLCEDFGQAVSYNGSIPECPNAFMLDDHHLFEKGRLVSVCGNTASMVMNSRFGKHFSLHGDGATHFGVFPCGPAPTSPLLGSGGSCC